MVFSPDDWLEFYDINTELAVELHLAAVELEYFISPKWNGVF